MRFTYQPSVSSGFPMPCTQEMFEAMLDDPRVAETCKQIASLDTHDPGFEDKKGNLKRQLPIAIFHACAFVKEAGQTGTSSAVKPAPNSAFPHTPLAPNGLPVADGGPEIGGPRRSANAIPSGLIMLDVDHVEKPRELFQCMKDRCIENNIYLVAITPSGHGLRIVAERKLYYSPSGEIEGSESIEDAQLRLSGACGFEEIDAVTKDLARASFMMPRSYVLHYQPEFLFDYPSEEAEAYWKSSTPACVAGTPSSLKEGTNTTDTSAETNLPCPFRGKDTAEPEERGSSYHDIPYSAIAEQLLLLMGAAGGAEKGERNTVYFTLATYMRYICDFNAELLLSILPDFGLGLQERKQAIKSAIGRPRKTETPLIVQSAISLAKNQSAVEGKNELKESACDLPLPKLPRMLQLICRRMPEAYRPAMVIASLPVLGTLATRIRFNYLDGQEHSLSFFACISAPCASGKSFIRRPIDLMLTPINEQDAIERQKEQEYMEKLRVSKNTKSQPEDPHACPRNNGVNISIAKLLQLLTYSEGKHLIGICEEMDTLAKSEKAGVWSQKSDIYRLGFDNSEYGQSYFSSNSFSAKVKVYYNLLLTGTPKSMLRFFKSDSVENGLMTRTCFAQLPDTSYTTMPYFEPYTAKEKKEIIEWSRALNDADGHIQCSAVEKAIAEWLEEKRQKALDADSHAADTIRRRAAVIGYRAGMLFYLLERKSNKQSVADLAVWVAEYVFRNQMEMFGDKLEQEITSGLEIATARGAASALIDLLPSEFEMKDLIAVRTKNNQSTKPTALFQLLRRWQDSGRIQHLGNHVYRKL